MIMQQCKTMENTYNLFTLHSYSSYIYCDIITVVRSQESQWILINKSELGLLFAVAYIQLLIAVTGEYYNEIKKTVYDKHLVTDYPVFCFNVWWHDTTIVDGISGGGIDSH